MTSIFVGRQPIFDCGGDTYAYELLFRASAEAQACVTDDLEGAAATIASAILDSGLERITQSKFAFINCTRDFLLAESHLLLPSALVVLEILENIEPTAALLEVLDRAKAAGFRLALDDFVYAPEYAALVPYADIIKIDWRLQTRDEIARDLLKLQDFKGQLLAEKIETHDEFAQAVELGFHYFQGYFFARPKTLTTKALPVSALQSLQHVASAERTDLEGLEEIFTQDVSASLRLLRYVNSAALALANEVKSVRHAARLVGVLELRKILKMVSVAGLAAEASPELLLLSLTRARFCEAFAKRINADPDQAFSLGLLSLVDALLGRPMDIVLRDISFDQAVKDCLLGDISPLNDLLQAAQAFARGDLSLISDIVRRHPVSSQDLALDYIAAIESAHAFFRSAVPEKKNS